MRKKYSHSCWFCNHCGICGQAPSDFPEIAQFLIDAGIDSISLNPDAVMPFIEQYRK